MVARQKTLRLRRLGVVSAVALLLLGGGTAQAVRENNVRLTEHNLSTTGTNTVKATTETQVCVFCHTPHNATTGAVPLWNKAVPLPTTYTGFTATSLDAATIQAGYTGQPGGSSKLCLSCHDGTLAMGNVNVLNGAGPATIALTGGSGAGTAFMPLGTGGLGTGYTSNFGTSLNADHPISVDYTAAVATKDMELNIPDANQRWPAGSVNPNIIVGIRDTATRPGDRPKLPLEKTGTGGIGQVQCATCHDPHIRETDATKGNQKFLRNNRFQEAAPTAGFNPANDQSCIACHEKDNGATGGWVNSPHANPNVATQTYKAAASTLREFPTAAAYNKVWNAACLNCHDTHTVQTNQSGGHLLREGSDGAMTGAATYAAGGYRASGNKAEQNTCYQCHTLAANSAITATAPLIDIEGELKGTGVGNLNNVAHPIAIGSDVHDVGGTFNDSVVGGAAANCSATNGCGADGMESRANLGVGDLTKRHVECTDCHNPHRSAKVQKISDVTSGAGYVAGGAHRHENAAGYIHDNIASGVLRGVWGVEPTYSTADFNAASLGITYTVKRGDPGTTPSTAVGSTYVTREYQVCLKCHSDYGYTDDNVYPSGNTRPLLGGTRLTAANTNGRANFTRYTNQAKEFNASYYSGTNPGNFGFESGACSTANTCDNNNHRSWHPVIGPTGRSTYGQYIAPWSNAGARGVQTMYCTDCHGTLTTSTGSVIPDNRSPTAAHTATSEGWGPHGGVATNNSSVFMLKGIWNQTASRSTSGLLCFKCHCATQFGGTSTGTCGGGASAYSGTGHGDSKHQVPCQYCHTPIVHGWKNKAFLVNLNDIGPEAGQARGTSSGSAYTNGPYYSGARLRVLTWRASGSWGSKSECENVNSH